MADVTQLEDDSRPVAPDHTCTLAIEELVSLTPEEAWEEAEA